MSQTPPISLERTSALPLVRCETSKSLIGQSSVCRRTGGAQTWDYSDNREAPCHRKVIISSSALQ